MIATASHSRSTTSSTCVENTTVPPPSQKRRNTSWMVCADTGSTDSNGSSRNSTRGACRIAAASATFLRMPWL